MFLEVRNFRDFFGEIEGIIYMRNFGEFFVKFGRFFSELGAYFFLELRAQFFREKFWRTF